MVCSRGMLGSFWIRCLCRTSFSMLLQRQRLPPFRHMERRGEQSSETPAEVFGALTDDPPSGQGYVASVLDSLPLAFVHLASPVMSCLGLVYTATAQVSLVSDSLQVALLFSGFSQ